MIERLRYRDKELTSDVTFRSGDATNVDHLAYLLKMGNAQHVYLEPGDYTRYELVLTPIEAGSTHKPQPGLLVTRLLGGRVHGDPAILWDWPTGASEFQIEEAAVLLSDGNQWAMILFMWWLALLCGRDDILYREL